jgi:hypothetical protein
MSDEMAATSANEEAAARVIRRIRLMTTISLGTLAFGFLAIMGAIGYRIWKDGANPPATLEMVHPGGRTISAVVSGSDLSVTVEQDGVTRVYLYDYPALTQKQVITLKPR